MNVLSLQPSRMVTGNLNKEEMTALSKHQLILTAFMLITQLQYDLFPATIINRHQTCWSLVQTTGT